MGSVHIIGATMLLHRFKFIYRLITFENKETQNRWKTDKFTCMKELFEGMNERNARMKHLFTLLAIDKTLYSYRGHSEFKQWNPNRTAKYGCNTLHLLKLTICWKTREN